MRKTEKSCHWGWMGTKRKECSGGRVFQTGHIRWRLRKPRPLGLVTGMSLRAQVVWVPWWDKCLNGRQGVGSTGQKTMARRFVAKRDKERKAAEEWGHEGGFVCNTGRGSWGPNTGRVRASRRTGGSIGPSLPTCKAERRLAGFRSCPWSSSQAIILITSPRAL